MRGMTKKRFRGIRGDMTQKAMAGLFEVSVQSIYYWEHGERPPSGPARQLLRLLELDRKRTIQMLTA